MAREVAPLIAAGGYRVYCPDLRGAGWTLAADPRVDRERRLRDLLALFDALAIERAHVTTWACYRGAAELRAPRAGALGRAAVRATGLHVVQPADRAGIPASAAVHLAPGGRFASTISAHLAPMANPTIDVAVRTLTRRMIMPEAMRMLSGAYKRRRLTVPTLVVFGWRDKPWTEQNLRRVCRHPERYADRVEFAYDSAHFIDDDAPDAVARLSLDWFDLAE